MSTKQSPNWGTVQIRRGNGTAAPRGTYRDVQPESAPDVEAELDRLAEARKEREDWLRAVLDDADDAEMGRLSKAGAVVGEMLQVHEPIQNDDAEGTE